MNEIVPKYVDGVSIVIPTFNRCPHPKDERNPLMWCISSIQQQTHEEIEIIVVDDASTDKTYTNMSQKFGENLNGIDLKYMRNEERQGSSRSRNIGTSLASNELVLFLDDDCVFMSKDAVATAVHSFKETEREGNDIGAMHLSVYYRSNRFTDVLPVKEILGIDYENACISCSTSSFPKERAELKEDDYFKGTHILKPLEVNNLADVFMFKKEVFLDVGGFSDHFPTPALGEAHELAQRLTRSGYKLFFAPDPKSALLHFKYGREDNKPVMTFGPLHSKAVEFRRSLKEKVDESRIVRAHTGNAVTVEEGMYSYVFGRSMIFNGNDSCKRKFEERVKDEIIENNGYVYFNRKVDDRDLRERICLDAISAAEMTSTSGAQAQMVWASTLMFEGEE
jgi:glycosyltransferase involved in cell wall biosynthesis